MFFTQWGPGEPSNIRGEGCVAMQGIWFHGTWNDTKCDVAKPYICKINSGPPRKLNGLKLLQILKKTEFRVFVPSHRESTTHTGPR